jgi:putative intracellular protease/amidase
MFTSRIIQSLSTVLLISTTALAGCKGDEPLPTDEPAGQAKRALFVVSNRGVIPAPGGGERESGVWFAEVTHPYWALADSRDPGFTIDIASPDGGRAAIDAFSVKLNLDEYLAGGAPDSGDPDNERFLTADETRDTIETEDVVVDTADGGTASFTRYAFKDTLRLADIDKAGYDLVMFAGGNAASYEFPDGEAVHRTAAEMYEAGKLVTAVCHGTSALLNVENGDQGYLVNDRHVTGFSNAEEEALGQLEVMPVLLEDEFPERGAHYTAGAPFTAHVVVDGRLITGQSPPSARPLGEAIVQYFSP